MCIRDSVRTYQDLQLPVQYHRQGIDKLVIDLELLQIQHIPCIGAVSYTHLRKEVALVKTSYGFKLKQYAPRLLDKVTHKAAGINDLILGRGKLRYCGDRSCRAGALCGRYD